MGTDEKKWTESGQEMMEALKEKIGGYQKNYQRELYYLEEVDSTNNEAKRQAVKGAAHGAVVIANRQTAGKGRRGRLWESPTDSGIFMTILLRPQVTLSRLSMLTLVAALAVSEAVEEETKCRCQIKWPNDLVMDKKKICGILTEMGTSGTEVQYVVVGIGINVGQREFPEELKEKASSLCLQTGQAICRADLVEKVLDKFEKYYAIWETQGDLHTLREQYEKQLVNLGNQVRVLAVDGEYSGVAVGITDTGELKVLGEDGELKEVLSGEVSVRGIYGYV